MLEIWAKKRSKAMEHAHYVGCGLGEACPNLSRACPAGKKQPRNQAKRRNGTPMMPMMLAKGASIISIIGGSVSPFLASHAPNDPSLAKIVSHPKLPLGLGASFQNGPCS